MINIMTYADLCYSYGDVYKKNSFEEISRTEPSYWYLINDVRVPRTKFTKSKKIQMQLLGIERIWNSGMFTFSHK